MCYAHHSTRSGDFLAGVYDVFVSLSLSIACVSAPFSPVSDVAVVVRSGSRLNYIKCNTHSQPMDGTPSWWVSAVEELVFRNHTHINKNTKNSTPSSSSSSLRTCCAWLRFDRHRSLRRRRRRRPPSVVGSLAVFTMERRKHHIYSTSVLHVCVCVCVVRSDGSRCNLGLSA